MAVPGSLPVLNTSCVSLAILASLSLSCSIHDVSRFERKHYFYPDLPHGYQVTQNAKPLASKGELVYGEDKKITKVKQVRHRRRHGLQNILLIVGLSAPPIHRDQVQLETDTGKSKKNPNTGSVDVDYNRAGSALIEVVFDPDIESPRDAADALRALRDLMKEKGVCDGRFESGSMRCDLNVSLWTGEGEWGERVEVKNMNSIRAVEDAANYEVERQRGVIEGGGAVARETRMFDKKAGVSIPMRKKEGGTDYRFMFDPDVPPLVVSKVEGLDLDELRARAMVREDPKAKSKRLEEVRVGC